MRIKTVEELREALVGLNKDDDVVLESCDPLTGDAEDLFPFYVDVIDLGNGHNEVRICQMTQDFFERYN